MGCGDGTEVRIGLLGPLRVEVDGEAVGVGGPKVQTILVTLAHQLGEVVTVDTRRPVGFHCITTRASGASRCNTCDDTANSY